MIFDQLIKPFRYLHIRHPHKWRVDWMVPALFALASIFFLHTTSGVYSLSKPDGIADKILDFLQTLPGFYIAALAIVTTLNNPYIDEIIEGIPPTLSYKFRGKKNTIQLSRRRFMALLFSFLTALSLLIIIYSAFYISLHDLILKHEAHFFTAPIAAIYLGSYIYFFLVYQLFVVTLWGLYFLGHRLQNLS